MLLAHFDILCDLFLNRCMAKRNLSAFYSKRAKTKMVLMTSSMTDGGIRTGQNLRTDYNKLYPYGQLALVQMQLSPKTECLT